MPPKQKGKRHPLSFRARKFCELYVLKYNGNATRAYMEAYQVDEKSAGGSIYALLENQEVLDEIDEWKSVLPQNLTKEKFTTEIARRALSPSTPDTARTKYAEMYAKMHGMLIEKSQVSVVAQVLNVNVDPSDGDIRGILSEMKDRLSLSSQGKITSAPALPPAVPETGETKAVEEAAVVVEPAAAEGEG